MKKRIIFVDDEPNILQGLRRMLRSMRKEYEMFFAEGGQNALEIMAEQTIDVVVSDMRMPGMDGAALLKEIQEKYPHTIRIMLTGQADEEAIMRTVGIVHQFLAKPCDPDKLKAILQRASALQDILTEKDLKHIVSRLGSLPSLPTTYQQLQRAIVKPDVSIREISGIIERDIAMCAKILQLVNSAFFGLFTTVKSPNHAVSLLGLETVKSLILGVGIFTGTKLGKGKLKAETLWQHSLSVARMAEKIATNETDNKQLIGNCFLAGMLHDIGKLVLMANMPEQYTQIIELAEQEQITLGSSELEVLRSNHADIGAYLTGLWGFETEVVEAIGFHHRLHSYPVEEFTPALAVHVADALFYQQYPGEIIGAGPELVDCLSEDLINSEKIAVWKELCQPETE